MGKDLMLDLETLGTSPSAAIVAIGAAVFDRDGVYDSFYRPVSLNSNTRFGRIIDPDTVCWWLRQSDEARKDIYLANDDEAVFGLERALQDFTAFFKAQNIQYVWGDGADFDNVIITDAYKSVGIQRPWVYRSNRCFRTLKNLFPIEERGIPKPTVAHNAGYDALYQARIASAIFKRYHILEVPQNS
jgi:hypothetical protein